MSIYQTQDGTSTPTTSPQIIPMVDRVAMAIANESVICEDGPSQFLLCKEEKCLCRHAARNVLAAINSALAESGRAILQAEGRT